MAYSRNSAPSGAGGASNASNASVSTTTTAGPSSRSGTESSVESQVTNTRGSSSSVTNTSGSATDRTSGTVRTTTKNMDDASLKALQDLIKSLSTGGSADDKRRWQQIQDEILVNQAQRQNYSKEASFADSSMAAAAQMFKALEQQMPTITAGIDSAGTSGSAMAALLTQNAAEAASRNAAQLQLDAAINYGQISNQASSIVADLLKIDNPATSQLLEALNIAKGAVQETLQVTDMLNTKNWNESQSSSSRSSQTSTTNSVGSRNWSETSTPQAVTERQAVSSPTTQPTTRTGGQRLITPSSYRSSSTNIYRNGNSYSQFG